MESTEEKKIQLWELNGHIKKVFILLFYYFSFENPSIEYFLFLCFVEQIILIFRQFSSWKKR